MAKRPAILIAACALGVALAHAQTQMYRSTMPDGKKVVSDRPMPGAVKVEELKVSPGNYAPGDPVPKAATVKPPATKTVPLPGAPGSKGVDREAAIAEARKAYEAALARQAKGREEGEGDRTGTYKGGARLSDEYYKRQEALQKEVDAARAALEAAQRQ